MAIVTAHPEFDYEQIVAAAPLVVDFRGVTRDIDAPNLVRLKREIFLHFARNPCVAACDNTFHA